MSRPISSCRTGSRVSTLLVVRDLASQLLINFCKLAKRFANYLKLPLNSGLQQRTFEVIVERLSSYELRNEI
jgi:hypothetical protein